MSRPPDPQLVALYQAAYRPLVGLLVVIGRDQQDAEEVAQDSFVRLIEHWPTIRQYEDPAAWVRMVAVRLLLKRQRRQATAKRHANATPPAPDNPGLDATDTRLVLDQAFAQLGPAHRAVVVLHYLYDLQLDEVGRVVDAPIGTVKSRLARARSQLGDLLTDVPDGSTP